MTDDLGVILVLAGGFFAGALLGHRLNAPSGVLAGTIVGVGCGLEGSSEVKIDAAAGTVTQFCSRDPVTNLRDYPSAT